ncbi:hypothetical protein AURDEDRAFT_174907 [Auricularia subglabra TFB-10046 SS5]|uniref:Uncharacterized protein n=1 Tax=Auricularia subglabra (strain TFB-10046 / SS5) TaxID=717982 RepID=J0D8T8_AURST|nr:hypothetical protein AURDEDRAFT_174907 [Auricularia subglabra TFB-10046 SS5]
MSVALLAASALLIIRVVAVSGFNRYHIFFFALYWLAEVGIVIYGLTLLEGVYMPELMSCRPASTSRSERLAVLTCFMLYLSCLACLAFSLLRSRGMGLWRLLLSQGVIYFAVSTIAFSCTSTFFLLDLNGKSIPLHGMNLIFEMPAVVGLVICATRLYRQLVAYDASEPDSFITAKTALDCTGNSPSFQLHDRGIVLPRSFTEYSVAEDSLTPNIAETPKRTSSDNALRDCV